MAMLMDAAQFKARVGPILLIQPPPPEARVAAVRTAPPKYTLPLPTLNANTLPAVGPFGDLLVATLPPTKADATLELTIGRDPKSDLVLEDPAASARHGALRYDGRKGILLDFGSVNGTFVNGRRIDRQEVLLPNDELCFGLSPFVYLYAETLHGQLLRWNPE
jgi:hypothetical protein